MYELKTHNLIHKMKRLDVQILGVSETHWLGSGCFEIEDYTVYFSGAEDGPHQRGVAMVCDKETAGAVEAFVPLSERSMMIRFAAHPFNINIIQAYAPTADKEEAEIETFYEELNTLLKMCKNHEITLIVGDMNAKVGEGPTGSVAGRYGLGEQNERGERLIQFCEEHNFIITNTWFQLPKRRLYTWKAPADNNNTRIRNQIDYIMMKRRFRNAVKSVKTYPGADIYSDHVLLSAEIKIRLKRVKKIRKQFLNTLKLDQPEYRRKVKESINNKLMELAIHDIRNNEVDESSKNFREKILQPTEDILGHSRKRGKNPWITQEILDLIDERRKHKATNEQEYRRVQKLVKKAVKQAKEKWHQKSCEEIEELIEKHDEFQLHKKLKETAGTYKLKPAYIMRDDDDHIVTGEHEQTKIWAEYIDELFNDNRREPPRKTENEESSGLEILQSEVEAALKKAPSRKAPGPDGVIAELLKLLNEDNIKKLTLIYNEIYRRGIIPEEWLQSKFIPIPKKAKTKSCGDFRLISLMSHLLKILLRIILRRIPSKCEEMISKEQYGFRPGMRTREALYRAQLLLQKCREFRKPVYACFIDFEKAFDRVQHEKLIQILKKIGLDEWDTGLITDLYWKQTAFVQVGGAKSNKILIKRGVRQGCILSPLLFNIYSEQIFAEALEEQKIGIRIGGEIINNIGYADDTVLLAESMPDLQKLLIDVNDACNRYGLAINIGKTKWMIVSKERIDNVQLELNNKIIERVPRFKYLCAWINENMDPDEEIKIRIALAKSTFCSWSKVLTSRWLSMPLRLRMLKCYVWTRLLYGCETWTLKTAIMNRLEAFEMWSYRRILKISWTEKVRNVDVLKRMEKERELLATNKRRKLEYLGHVLRGPKYELLQTIMYGRIEGKRWIGRKAMSWLRNLRMWTNLTPEELFHSARDRDKWRNIVHSAVATA